MRVALVCDEAVVGRTLSDLLRSLRYEVLPTPEAGTPQLHLRDGRLLLVAPDGQQTALEQPVRLSQLAQQLRGLQSQARGTPLSLQAGWRLEPLARMLHHESGQHVPLTEKEALLLGALHAALPRAASREHLLRDVWAYDGDVETHTLETHIYRLRAKLSGLNPVPADIVTSDGTYRLALE